MQIVAKNVTIKPSPDKEKILNFLSHNLNKKNIPFDEIRTALDIKISNKDLHRIAIDAGYGVIK